MKSKRVAMYLRVSTADKGQDTAMQLRELEQYAKLREFGQVTVYEDKGFTGTNTKRPALQRLLKEAKQRKFDIVLVWKLDRFARSLKELVNMISELNEFGVEFCSLKDALDLSTSQGRLMFHMIGAFSQFESDLIRMRVKAGLEHARSKGKTLGRPKRRDDERIVRLRKKGLSIKAIALKIGMSKKTVQNSLRGRENPNPVNA